MVSSLTGQHSAKKPQFLKQSLIKEPILRYPDPKKPHVLFTDASIHAWACTPMQCNFYEHEIDEKEVEILHPIPYMSGLFHGSQMSWAALAKEAYRIYVCSEISLLLRGFQYNSK